MPKYCKDCCLQGHDEHNCWTLHPELYEAMREEDQKIESKADSTVILGTVAEQRRVLASGKIVGNKQNRQEWMIRRTNKYKRDKYGHIEGEVEYNHEIPLRH